MTLEDKAWKLYCEETAGDMDVRDFWEELSPYIQKIYLEKVQRQEEWERASLRNLKDFSVDNPPPLCYYP